MGTTPEGRVAAALRQAVIENGGEIRKVNWEGRLGAPDYLVMLNGRALFIETKAPGGKPRASQLLEFDRITETDTLPVIVVDDASSCSSLVRIIEDGTEDEYEKMLARYTYRRFYTIGG